MRALLCLGGAVPWAVFAGLTQLTGAQFLSAISPCPIQCDPTGSNDAAWTYYHDFGELDACDGTVLFQTNIYNDIDDPKSHIYFRACTAAGGTVLADGTQGVKAPSDDTNSRNSNVRRQALAVNETAPSLPPLSLVSWGGGSDVDTSAAQAALDALHDYANEAAANDTIIFSWKRPVVAGMYVGSQIDKSSAASTVSSFQDAIDGQSRLAVQTCGQANQTISPQYFGLIYDAEGNVPAVQKALKSWNSAECVEGDSSKEWQGSELKALSGNSVPIGPDGEANDLQARSRLQARDTCRYTQVQAGDGCYAVAERCGCTQDELASYNGGGNFCSALKVDQYVCCTPGDPPDFSPQPNADGTCASYTIQQGDYCAKIAEAHSMEVQDILDRNTETWGWQGCGNIFLGMKICLSTGRPPFPATVPNAVCGPQVNGTEPTDDVSGWTDLNPCPLNACCDIFGQCGITSDFCTPNPADTGNPGTAQPGSNGCISNCGTDIITSGGPSTFERIGYFEAFNAERPCMHLSVGSIPDKYTIVHWAFADITDSFQPSISPYEDAWEDFKKETRFKRIVSFGGWTFSTAPNTFNILREGVKSENRQTFANNVAQFIKDEGLDGVDFDWEYPGAPDDQGEGIPVDSPESADNYLEFLKLLRDALPSEYTMAIAIPASYYYLKAFPADKLGDLLDYFIYMTYDLHGQWDYGNKFTNPGCPMGNCLRSQINQTETESALSMLTKAGVASNKIMLGQPLYGRSFEMTDPSCYTEECTFTGPSSGARAGNCTSTPGYLANLEIRNIINGGEFSVQQFSSQEAGDILVYDGNWVSWMKDSTYDQRRDYAQGLGLGGTSDWAIDLNVTGDAGGGGNDTGNGNGTGSGVVSIDPSVFDDPDPTVTCQPPCTFVFPPWTLPYTTTISPPPITTSVTDRWPYISTISGTVTTTVYVSKTTVTTITPSPVTTTEIPLWNVEWTDTDDSIIQLTSSIILPPVTLTQDSTVVTSDDKTTTIAGIIYTYSQGPYPPITAPTPSQTTTDPVPPPPTSCDHCPPAVTGTIGPPGPLCDIGCGALCAAFCSPDLPCIGICGCIGLGCPGGGGCVGPGCSGGDNNNNDDNNDEEDDPEENDKCMFDTSIGMCDNGNFPIFDPQSGQMSCDGSMEPSECQQKIDDNIDSIQDYLENEKDCCPNSAKVKRASSNNALSNFFYDVRDTFGSVFKRQTGGSCPAPQADPRNPPQGQCLVTYRCPHEVYPNVCGNAKSAIQDRGKTSILTHRAGSDNHDTSAWYRQSSHYFWKQGDGQPMSGWKLDSCEVEEYPFGSGDPNPRGRSRQWDRYPVLRLIPGGGGENQNAGGHLSRWLASVANQYNLPSSNGIVYCVDFDPSFTQYLPEQTDNYCAAPYGVGFTLVNGLKVQGGGSDDPNYNERWDPWFNQQVGRRNYQFIKNTNAGAIYANIPPQFCRAPSPGRMGRTSIGQGAFYPYPDFESQDRDDSDPKNVRCEDIPDNISKRDAFDSEFEVFAKNKTVRKHSRDVYRRQSGGSFTDARIFKFFGCEAGAGTYATDPCSTDPQYCEEENDYGPDDPLPGPEGDPAFSTGPTRTFPDSTTSGSTPTTTGGGDDCFVPAGCQNVAAPTGCAVLCDGPTTTSSTTSCFVPAGCENRAAPTGCAVLCDAPTTTTTTSSTLPPAPTNTATDPRAGDVSYACYDPEDNPDHLRFIFDDYVGVTKAFCDQNYVLGAGNTFGYVEQYTAGDHRTQVYAKWADDQSGCGEKKDFAFSSEDKDSDRYTACRNAFVGPFKCHRDQDNTDGIETSYGGYYVFDSGDGCIFFDLYALALQNQKRDAPSFLTPNTTADEPSAVSIPASGFYNMTTLEWVSSNKTSNTTASFDSELLGGLNVTIEVTNITSMA